MKKFQFLLLYLILSFPLVAQDTILFMTYNILNYPGTTSAARNNHFKVTMNAVKPDVLVIQEVTSQIGIDGFLVNVLKTVSPNYNKGAWLDGPDTDNGIFYDSTKFDFLSNTRLPTELRDINLFQLRHRITGDTLFVFSVHLKASNTSADQAQRGREVDVIRNMTNTWPAGRNFIVCGDFNIYASTEVAYQKLRAVTAGTEGHVIDPIVMTGTWNQGQYAIHHTQSPRTRSFEGGTTGGMDDRFDMILFSQAISDTGGVEFLRNSYVAYGNDGLHYNDSINRPPNTAVGQTIANALHYGSDHLPVYAKFVFKDPLIVPVELSTFSATFENHQVILKWSTSSETNNYGFEIEKKNLDGSFRPIGFVRGVGTSTATTQYNFIDENLESRKEVYRLRQIDFDGRFNLSHQIEVDLSGFTDFILYQNFPNPFNPGTTITWDLPTDGNLILTIHNSLGQVVLTERLGNRPSGYGSYYLNASALPSGNYFARLEFISDSGAFFQIIKLNLLK